MPPKYILSALRSIGCVVKLELSRRVLPLYICTVAEVELEIVTTILYVVDVEITLYDGKLVFWPFTKPIVGSLPLDPATQGSYSIIAPAEAFGLEPTAKKIGILNHAALPELISFM